MIKDLKEGMATRETALCQSVEERTTKTGNAYVEMLLSDRESSIKVKIWDTNKAHVENYVGKVVDLTIKTEVYNGALSYTGDMIALNPNVPASQLVPAAPYDSGQMHTYLLNVAATIKNPAVRALTETLLNENKEKLLYYPAAQTIHHNCYGGLLYHMYRMVWAGSALAKLYGTVNRDILISGAILHDIGKLLELSATPLGTAEYSEKGRLFGHAYLGMQMIEEAARKLNTPPEAKEAILHIVASHHGTQEWGAITKPQTLEAYLVHELDMIDSRAYQYEKAVENIEPGTFSQKIFGLGTPVFRPMVTGGDSDA